MDPLIKPPSKYALPLSKDGDLYVVFTYKPLLVDEDGEPVLDVAGQRQYVTAPYPAGAQVRLVIEAGEGEEPITIEATIDGPHATVWEDYLVANTVEKKRLWRAVITYANGLDKVLCNGMTTREDGKE